MTFPALVAGTDRAVQRNLGAVEITYQPSVGAPVLLQAMFDPTFVLDDQGRSGVEQTVPSVFFRLEDLPLDPDDDDPTITVAGVDYRVRERIRDRVGESVRLLLHRAGA